jgi:Tfp pilus assembly protein FimT
MTIAVLSILLTVAIPGFYSTLLRVKASAATDSLTAALYYARNTAVTKGEGVILCALDENEVPAPKCDSTAINWNRGWIATDLDGNLLKYWKMADADKEVTLSVGATAHNTSQARFNALGESNLYTAAGVALTTKYTFGIQMDSCDTAQLDIRREVAVSISGAVKVSAGLACL